MVIPTQAGNGASGEDALITSIVQGEQAALRTLYDRYGGAMQSVATKVLRDVNLAEDVVQDVFVNFWRNPGTFDATRGNLRTFLVMLTHRRAVDVVRSEVARKRREERRPDRDYYDLAQDVETRDLGSAVRAAVESLEAPEREAISLAYFGGLSYVQVAEHLGAPEGTIKSRIRTGMKKLSPSLSGYQP